MGGLRNNTGSSSTPLQNTPPDGSKGLSLFRNFSLPQLPTLDLASRKTQGALLTILLTVSVIAFQCTRKGKVSPDAVRGELPSRMKNELTDEEVYHYYKLAEDLVAQGYVSADTKPQVAEALGYLTQQGVDTDAEQQEFQAVVLGAANLNGAGIDVGDENRRGGLDGAIGAGTLGAVSQAVGSAEQIPDGDDQHDDAIEYSGDKPFDRPLPPEFTHITSSFGRRRSPKPGATSNHGGIDIRVPGGTPVHVTKPGKVVFAGEQVDNIPGAGVVNDVLNWLEKNGYKAREALKGAGLDPTEGGGRGVTVEHDDGFRTYYGHLQDYSVTSGQQVNAGDVIGHTGSTGTSTGDHLHYEVRKGERTNRVNPLDYTNKPGEGGGGNNKTRNTILALLAALGIGGVAAYRIKKKN